MNKPDFTIDGHQDCTTVSSLSHGGVEESLLTPTFLRRLVVGRTREHLQLLQTYEQVKRSNGSAVAMVHGISGVGKTTLVENLRECICDSRGFFSSGKFFQNTGVNEPYSAIMTAFSDLCDLVSQSHDFDEDRMREICQALGPHCGVLSRVISNLGSVTGVMTVEGGDTVDPQNEVAYTKFKVACMHFLHAMTSPTHPIVMFLDDIQWMDEGSRHLIKMLLHDASFRNIFLVLSYRDENADKIDSLFSSEEIRSRVVDVHVECLERAAVCDLISVLLGTNSASVPDFSNILWRKTAGNPFHVLQLMEHLKKEGLLTSQRDEKGCFWSFDADEIREQIQLSDSVAGLLARKAERLDPAVPAICKVASLLGFQFDEEVIVGLCSSTTLTARQTGPCEIENDSVTRMTSTTATSTEAVSHTLATAVDEGLLERTTGGFRFEHDRVQSCFQSMMTSRERANTHKMIGEWYLHRGDPESLYAAASHLNQADGYCEGTEKKVEMAQLNLSASIYCRDKSAFVDAADFLRRANKLLDSDRKWLDNHNLAFEIAESLAKVEKVVCNFDASMKITGDALTHCRSLHQIISLSLIEVEGLLEANDVDATMATVNRSLNLLGMKIPPKISILHVLKKYLKVRKMMRSRSDSDILSMPVVDDVLKNAAVRLLFYGSIFSGQKSATNDLIYFTLQAVELTFSQGLSPFSPPALSLYATLHATMGNHALAYRIGTLAMAMLDRIICTEVLGTTLTQCKALASHWRDTIESLGQSFGQAMEHSFEHGDLGYALFSCSNSMWQRLYTGENLESLESFQRLIYRRALEFGNNNLMLYWITPLIQFVLNLRRETSSWVNLAVLDGEMMTEREFIKDALDASNTGLQKIFWTCKLLLAYHFGFLEEAAFAVKELVALDDPLARSYFIVYQWYFLASSVGYELYRSTGQRRHLRSARKYHKDLEKLKESPNSTPFLSFLEAQEVASKRKSSKIDVTYAFDQAIRSMAERKWVHMEGLVNERFALYLANAGRYHSAEPYLKRAIELYRDDWGSIAKSGWLKAASAQALRVIAFFANDVTHVSEELYMSVDEASETVQDRK